MFSTVLILFVVALALSAVLWVGTLFVQGALYEAPVGELYWRAPAAGAGLTLFLALWVIADCRTGGRVRPLHQTQLYETKTYDELKAVLERNGPEVAFSRPKHAARGTDFRADDGRRLPQTPQKVIVQEGGAAVALEPERDGKGNFRRDPGQNLRYRDKYGRVMVEGDLGEVSQFHWDWLLLNIFFNLFFFALWFAALWPLLRFQWPHALGLAVVLWLATTLAVVPMVLDYAERAFHVASTAL